MAKLLFTLRVGNYLSFCVISLVSCCIAVHQGFDYAENMHNLYKGRALSRSQNMVAQFLVPQNQIRAKVGDPPLRWSKKLATYARWWANQRRGYCSLTHSKGPYGENIFWGGGKNWQPRDAVSAWIGEKNWYNYKRNSCNGYEECGHYTQVVWRKSRSVGCAKVICNNGDVFMTCNYDPPGNYIGQKPY